MTLRKNLHPEVRMGMSGPRVQTKKKANGLDMCFFFCVTRCSLREQGFLSVKLLISLLEAYPKIPRMPY